jgi:hypothetical protein
MIRSTEPVNGETSVVVAPGAATASGEASDAMNRSVVTGSVPRAKTPPTRGTWSATEHQAQTTCPKRTW